MKYIDAEKLIAEIERRIGLIEVSAIRTSGMNKMLLAFRDILSFIESMEKESIVVTKDHPLVKDAIRAEKEQKVVDKVMAIAKPLTEEQKQAYETGQLKHLEEYKKWKEEREKSPKIKGWVARDACGRTSLFLNKPTLNKKWKDVWEGEFLGDEKIISNYQYEEPQMPWLTFENSPIEVELTIHRV